MAVKVLGPLETGSEPLRPRERAILAALVVRAGVVVSPAELAEAYWGERVPVTWVQQVRTSVAWIRQRLGHEAVETVGPDYRLVIDPETIDAVRFERLVSSARQHALRGEDDRAIDAYRRALGLWRGAPFVELSGWQPGVVEAMRLDEIRRSAQEELLEARLRAGEHRAVIPEAERLVREEPLREDRWAILALATYRADRQGEALAVLREARRRLADELGVDPGRRLTDLEAGVLRQDPALAPVTVMRQVSRDCPYRGLAAFGPDDAEWFFGREADVDQLVERARPGAVVAVAGPSGSGKSSLLLAGVLPRLAGRGRTVQVLRPGHASLVELRDATSADVLAVDQAEELLRAGGDIEAFCAQVWRFARAGGTVLLTVRSDFLDAAAALPHVGAAVGRGVYLLGPLAGDGLREAIVQPAVRAGLRLEPGLVEVVLRDAAGRPGALPHLSHALVETWLRREGATLTVAGYEAAGGIAGAIGQSAEDLYASLGPDERELCRSVMLRLVERVSEGTVVRRRVAAGPLLDDPDRRRVLDRLVAARLVAVDEEAVALAHEAVATAWPRLAGWLDEDAEGGRLMSALAAVSETWQDGGRVDEDLARGARLTALLEWRDASHPDLTAVETAFLDASAAREQDEVRTVTERAARDRRQNRRLRASLAGVGALLVVALAAGGVAVVRNGQAAASRADAQREALVATSLALRGTDRDVAALLAAEAYRRWPDDPRARAALMGTVTAAGGYLGSTTIPDEEGLFAVALIPGTHQMVVSRATGELAIRDVDTGALLRSLDPPLPPSRAERPNEMAVSADGSTLVVLRLIRNPGPADDEHEPSFYDLRSGRRIGSPLIPNGWVDRPAISPDGALAAWVGNRAPLLTVVETATGTVRTLLLDLDPLPRFDPAAGDLEAFAVPVFTADGTLLVGGNDGRILQIDPASMTITRALGPWPGATEGALASLDDGTLVAAGPTGVVRVDLATGAALWHQLVGGQGTGDCGHLAVSQAHGLVFCAMGNDTIDQRSLATGQIAAEPLTHGSGAIAKLVLPDADTLVAIPATSGVLPRWRIDGGGLVTRVVAPGLALRGETYDPTGRYLLAGTAPEDDPWFDAPIGAPYSVWDATTGQRVLAVDEGMATPGIDASWLGAGRLIVTDTDPDGKNPVYRVIDVRTGVSSDAGDIPDDACCLWPAPDGAVYVQDPDHRDGFHIDAYDGATLTRTGLSFPLDGGEPYVVTFTPDGAQVAFTTYQEGPTPYTTSVYDTRTGRLVARGLVGKWVTAITPSGDVVGVTPDGVALYDATTLERVRPLPRAVGQAWSLHVSNDGHTLLAWTRGQTAVQLVDLRSGALLGDGLPASFPPWEGAALRPDGRELAYTVAQGIAIWDLDPAHQYAAACHIAGRELTTDEWATYLADLGPWRATCADVLPGT